MNEFFEVHDDFLPQEHFKQLQSNLLGDRMWWFFNNFKVKKEDDEYQFINVFYSESGPTSSYFMIEPIISFLKPKKIHRIKANLNTRTPSHRRSAYHTDGFPCNTTSILYVNTHNGSTFFKKGGKIKCIENRLVTFDSKLEHAGVTCTDEQRKVLINFNYDI